MMMMFVSYEYFQIMIVKSGWSHLIRLSNIMSRQRWDRRDGNPLGHRPVWGPKHRHLWRRRRRGRGKSPVQLWLQLLQLWWRLQLQPLSDDMGFGLFNLSCPSFLSHWIKHLKIKRFRLLFSSCRTRHSGHISLSQVQSASGSDQTQSFFKILVCFDISIKRARLWYSLF